MINKPTQSKLKGLWGIGAQPETDELNHKLRRPLGLA
jgi:hypothetical protein